MKKELEIERTNIEVAFDTILDDAFKIDDKKIRENYIAYSLAELLQPQPAMIIKFNPKIVKPADLEKIKHEMNELLKGEIDKDGLLTVKFKKELIDTIWESE